MLGVYGETTSALDRTDSISFKIYAINYKIFVRSHKQNEGGWVNYRKNA